MNHNLKITNSTLKFIKKEKCPKQLDKDKLEQNRKYIKLKVKKIFYDRIISLENEFNNKIYNIKQELSFFLDCLFTDCLFTDCLFTDFLVNFIKTLFWSSITSLS